VPVGVVRLVAEARMAFDAGEISARLARSGSACADLVPPPLFELPEGVEARGRVRRHPGSRPPWVGRSSTSAAENYPSSTSQVDKKRSVDDRQRPRRALPKVQVAAASTRSRRPASTGRPGRVSRWRSPTSSPRRRSRDPRGLRGEGRQGPEAVRARSDHRRRAPSGAHRDLDPRPPTRSPRRWRPTSRGPTPIFRMVDSGARGNWMQLRQIAGMRAWCPTRRARSSRDRSSANFREGLSVLEFFISTHGRARVWPTPRCGPPTRVT
jgi:DNA-directed RNA polymerase subunit beta'